MKVVYGSRFLKKLKKVDVRIKKSVKERILLFSKNPQSRELDNHELRDRWEGHRSVDITGDYRALYKERQIGEETVAYFVTFGTHDELYKPKKEQTD